MPRSSLRTRVTLLVLALPWAWGADRDPAWTITPTANATLVETAEGLRLAGGRIQVTIPTGSEPFTLWSDPFHIETREAILIIERTSSSTFVAVIAGSALMRDNRPEQRDLLLQPRQGVGGEGDGSLSDILTFTRLPRIDDARPLTMQADLAHDGEPWPEAVPEKLVLVAAVPADPAPVAPTPPVTQNTERVGAKVPVAAPAAATAQPTDAVAVFESQRVAPVIAMPTDSLALSRMIKPESSRDATPALPAWQQRNRR